MAPAPPQARPEGHRGSADESEFACGSTTQRIESVELVEIASHANRGQSQTPSHHNLEGVDVLPLPASTLSGSQSLFRRTVIGAAVCCLVVAVICLAIQDTPSLRLSHAASAKELLQLQASAPYQSNPAIQRALDAVISARQAIQLAHGVPSVAVPARALTLPYSPLPPSQQTAPQSFQFPSESSAPYSPLTPFQQTAPQSFQFPSESSAPQWNLMPGKRVVVPFASEVRYVHTQPQPVMFSSQAPAFQIQQQQQMIAQHAPAGPQVFSYPSSPLRFLSPAPVAYAQQPQAFIPQGQPAARFLPSIQNIPSASVQVHFGHPTSPAAASQPGLPPLQWHEWKGTQPAVEPFKEQPPVFPEESPQQPEEPPQQPEEPPQQPEEARQPPLVSEPQQQEPAVREEEAQPQVQEEEQPKEEEKQREEEQPREEEQEEQAPAEEAPKEEEAEPREEEAPGEEEGASISDEANGEEKPVDESEEAREEGPQGGTEEEPEAREGGEMKEEGGERKDSLASGSMQGWRAGRGDGSWLAPPMKGAAGGVSAEGGAQEEEEAAEEREGREEDEMKQQQRAELRGKEEEGRPAKTELRELPVGGGFAVHGPTATVPAGVGAGGFFSTEVAGRGEMLVEVPAGCEAGDTLVLQEVSSQAGEELAWVPLRQVQEAQAKQRGVEAREGGSDDSLRQRIATAWSHKQREVRRGTFQGLAELPAPLLEGARRTQRG